MFTFSDQVMSWYVNGKEKELSMVFLDEGFDVLKEKLDICKEEEWDIIKDNFIIYSGLIVVLVVKNIRFFTDLLMSNGAGKVREILQLSDKKYDGVFGVVLDALLDGFCKKKYEERQIEFAQKTLDEILELLDSYGV